jgi:hypothetical protein
MAVSEIFYLKGQASEGLIFVWDGNADLPLYRLGAGRLAITST